MKHLRLVEADHKQSSQLHDVREKGKWKEMELAADGVIQKVNNVEDDFKYKLDAQRMAAGLSKISNWKGQRQDTVGGRKELSDRKEEQKGVEYARQKHKADMVLKDDRDKVNLDAFRRNAAIAMQNSLVKNRKNEFGIAHFPNGPFNQLSNMVDEKQKRKQQRLSRLGGDLVGMAAEAGQEQNKPVDGLQERDKHFPVGVGQNRPPFFSSSLRHILGEFNVEGYLSSQRMLQDQGDPMSAIKFNQVASDATPPDRVLSDHRPNL